MLSKTFTYAVIDSMCCWSWLTAVTRASFINVTLVNNKRSSRISRQTKSITVGFYAVHIQKIQSVSSESIQQRWFIFSLAPKSDVSFWDGAPSPLILPLSWKQTFRAVWKENEEEEDEGSHWLSGRGLSSLLLMTAAQGTAELEERKCAEKEGRGRKIQQKDKKNVKGKWKWQKKRDEKFSISWFSF